MYIAKGRKNRYARTVRINTERSLRRYFFFAGAAQGPGLSAREGSRAAELTFSEL
jgi:hypothetical protein